MVWLKSDFQGKFSNEDLIKSNKLFTQYTWSGLANSTIWMRYTNDMLWVYTSVVLSLRRESYHIVLVLFLFLTIHGWFVTLEYTGCGKWCQFSKVCPLDYADDLKFWGINESFMEFCCQVKHHSTKSNKKIYSVVKRKLFREWSKIKHGMLCFVTFSLSLFMPG